MTEIKKIVDEFKPKIRAAYGNRKANLYKIFFQRMLDIAYPPEPRDNSKVKLLIRASMDPNKKDEK